MQPTNTQDQNSDLQTTCQNIGTCKGECGDAIRGRSCSYHITMGHPGFNSPVNNTASGYYSYSRAANSLRLYANRKTKVKKIPRNACPDCGEPDEIRGHMTCQYPTDEERS